MRRFKKTLVICMAFVLLLSNLLPVYAESNIQDGVQITIQTDKESYSQGENITATVTVTNTNNYAIKNVTPTITVPDGYQLSSSEGDGTISELAANGTVTMTQVFVPKPIASFNTADGSVMLEAEATTLDMDVVALADNTSASDDKAVRMIIKDTEPTKDSAAGMNFNIVPDQTGTYYVWARVICLKNNAESMWISYNGADYQAATNLNDKVFQCRWSRK